LTAQKDCRPVSSVSIERNSRESAMVQICSWIVDQRSYLSQGRQTLAYIVYVYINTRIAQ
jgi:hypothetical protein